MDNQVYKVNAGAVQSDIIDGEAVVIHTETGRYFCMNPAGSTLWQWLAGGASAASMVEALAAGGADRTAVAEAVGEFLQVLVRENLVVETPTPEGRPAPTGGAFQVPRVEVYTDMEQFLLVDPVHEIDGEGIPKKGT